MDERDMENVLRTAFRATAQNLTMCTAPNTYFHVPPGLLRADLGFQSGWPQPLEAKNQQQELTGTLPNVQWSPGSGSLCLFPPETHTQHKADFSPTFTGTTERPGMEQT